MLNVNCNWSLSLSWDQGLVVANQQVRWGSSWRPCDYCQEFLLFDLMISIILLYVIMTCHFRSTCCTAWLAVYMIDNCNRSKQSFSFHHLCRYLFFIHIFREEGTMMRNKGEQDSEAMSCPSWQSQASSNHSVIQSEPESSRRTMEAIRVNRNQADTPWKAIRAKAAGLAV